MSSSNGHQWPSATTPRNSTNSNNNSLAGITAFSSSSSVPSTTRLHISASSIVSSRGRKKMTPSPAAQRLPLSTVPASSTTILSTNDGKKKKPPKFVDWPASSVAALPKLSDHLVQGLQQKNLEFPINEECTSLKLSPSGRLMVACFSDGTIRLFDLTGTFAAQSSRIIGSATKKSNNSTKTTGGLEEGLFDMDSSSDEEEIYRKDFSSPTQQGQPESPGLLSDSYEKRGGRNRYVLSKEHQRFGTVATQIHAKGVITSLLMDVDVAEDSNYIFAGALRGSQELVAVHLGCVEDYLDKKLAQQQSKEHSEDGSQTKDLLDLITVYRYSDAKLRGFGACTRLRNGKQKPEYLLFAGKAVGKIHIWKFEPPMDVTRRDEDAGKWSLLYDCATNGNTNHLLQFRYETTTNLLQGISKSGDQKLRLWDLSYEQHQGNKKNPFYSKRSVIEHFATQQEKTTIGGRPKRPPYLDVTSSETTESICGGFAVCCGDNTYNQISLLKLDLANPNEEFNHTEFALPGSTTGASMVRSRRQQRGELKSITNISGMAMDPSTFLLEVSDGTIVQYSDESISHNGQSKIEPASFSVGAALSMKDGATKICVGKLASEGVVVAAVSCYNSNNSRGSILLRAVNEDALSAEQRPNGFWGFSPRLSKKGKKASAAGTAWEETPKSAPISTISTSVAVQHQANHQTVMSPHSTPNIGKYTNPPSAVQASRAQKNATTAGVQLFGGSDHPKTILAPSENTKAKAMVPSQKDSKPTSTQNPPLPTQTKRKGTVVPDSSVKKSKLEKAPTNETPRHLKGQSYQASAALVPASSVKKSNKLGKPPLPTSKDKSSQPRGDSLSGVPASAAKVGASNKKQDFQVPVATSNSAKPRQGTNVSPEQTPVATKNATNHKEGTRATLSDLAEVAAASDNSKDTTSTLKQKPVDRIPGTPNDTPEKVQTQQVVNARASEGAKEVSPDSKASGGSARVVSVAKSSSHARPSTPTIPAASILAVPRKPNLEEDAKGGTSETESVLKPKSSTTKRRVDPSSGDAKPRSKVAKTAANSDVGSSAAANSGDKPPKTANKATAKKSQFANRPAFIGKCAETAARLSLLAQQHLPSKPVEERMGLANVSPSSTTLSDLAAGQELARMKLAAQHRSEHELTLKRILQVAQDAVKEMTQAKSLVAVDEAEENFQEGFKWYYDLLEEAIWRQSEEAKTLADQQRQEIRHTPVLHVSFPFYGVFNAIVECMDAIMSTVRSG